MKRVEDVLATLGQRVDDRWHTHLDDPDDFTFSTPLLTSASGGLTASALMAWAQDWHRWYDATTRDDPTQSNLAGLADRVVLGAGTRRVGGIAYPGTPDRLTVTSLDAAAAITGHGRTARLARGRTITARLRTAYPDVSADATAYAVRRLVDASDVDVDLAVLTVAWFSGRPRAETAGLHPRQVPVAGVHGKWLESHQRLLETLLGRSLNLSFGYPPQFRFRYADPAHLAAGGRRHDLAVVGDTAAPAYSPTVVLVVENKHTARNFPPRNGLIVVEGNGGAAHPLAKLEWIRACPRVVYWGDLDAAGLEILDGVRRAGLPQTRSLLMDCATYERFEEFGAEHDAGGQLLGVPERKQLDALTAAEAALYAHLTDPGHTRTRRIEQERIPLPYADDALDTLPVSLEGRADLPFCPAWRPS
jgi:hypothetical protein